MTTLLRGRLAGAAGSLAIAAAGVALLLRIEAPEEVAAALGQASLWLVALATIPALSFGLARAWRYRILLGPRERRPKGDLLAVTLAGWSVSLLLPGVIGEAAFVGLARTRLQAPIMRATGAVFLARLLDATSLLLIALSTAAIAGVRLPGPILPLAALLVSAALAALVALLWSAPRRVLLRILSRLPRGSSLSQRISQALEELSRSQHLGGLIAATALARCSTALLYFCLFKALGVEVTLWQVWFALSVRTLLLAVPLQGFGGFGTTQIWWTAALTLLGLPIENAAGAALAVHVLDLAVSLPVALAGWVVLLLRHSGRRFSEPGPDEPWAMQPMPSPGAGRG
jgi:hypothetical protein